jgi:hypothetical protein
MNWRQWIGLKPTEANLANDLPRAATKERVPTKPSIRPATSNRNHNFSNLRIGLHVAMRGHDVR